MENKPEYPQIFYYSKRQILEILSTEGIRKKNKKDERKIGIFLITGQQLLLYCVE
jgi:hypothetical protein